MWESCQFWRCYMWGDFWPTAPSWTVGAEYDHSSFHSMHVPLLVLGERRSGTLSSHGKNTKIIGYFQMTIYSKVNITSETYCFTPWTFALVASQDFLGRSQPANFPSRCQQAGPGEPCALWSLSAQPVTRHQEAVLGLAISMPTCSPWCHGGCAVSCRVLYTIYWNLTNHPVFSSILPSTVS